MPRLDMLLLQVEPQARAEYDFDLQPTTKTIYWRDFFIVLAFLVSLLWVLHIFWGNYFCFTKFFFF